MLARSMESYGAGRSILVDKEGVVIAGNKTLEAAADAGMGVKVVEVTGNELVVVQRTALDLDGADHTARELAYADNRVGEVSLAWDGVQLGKDIQAGIDLEKMFFGDELSSLIGAEDGESGGVPGKVARELTCPNCGHIFE